jgi:hypothetical protein
MQKRFMEENARYNIAQCTTEGGFEGREDIGLLSQLNIDELPFGRWLSGLQSVE